MHYLQRTVVELYFDNTKRLETKDSGVAITGTGQSVDDATNLLPTLLEIVRLSQTLQTRF